MKFQKEFEEVFLGGRERTLLLSSQLDIGADGNYFNPHTAKMYYEFAQGWETMRVLHEASFVKFQIEELKKAISLLEEVKKLTTEHHINETYFANLMVIKILPEIGQFLREVKL